MFSVHTPSILHSWAGSLGRYNLCLPISIFRSFLLIWGKIANPSSLCIVLSWSHTPGSSHSMWLNFIFLTPFGEPCFAFWLMALLSYQQDPPFTFDVELNREISIICNFGWIDVSMICHKPVFDLQFWRPGPGINTSINYRCVMLVTRTLPVWYELPARYHY